MAKKKASQTLPVLKDSYDERSKYDWPTIRNDYIYGTKNADGTIFYPKPADLEKKYNVPAQLVSNRVTKEKWIKHREAHQNEQALAVQKEHQKRLATMAVKFDEQAANDAVTAEKILSERLSQISKLQAVDKARINEILDDITDGRPIDRDLRDELKPLVSSYELESILKSYALAQEVGHKALGITDGNKPEINNNITIQQVSSASENLAQMDDLRKQAIEKFFQNPNVRISGLTDKPKEIEDTIDAEVIEDDDS